MPLYLLRQVSNVDWDENAGLVIRAKNEIEARQLANENCIDQIWEDKEKTMITEIKNRGKSKIIVGYFYTG